MNTVNIHITLKTHEPKITIMVGARVLPIPLEAAIVQSINAETLNANAIIHIFSIPASITAGVSVNILKNKSPLKNKNAPKISAIIKE